MSHPVPSHCSLCSLAFEDDAMIQVHVDQPSDKQGPPRVLPYCHSLVSHEIWLCHDDCFTTTKPSDRQLLFGSSVFSFPPSPREEKQRLNFFKDCAAALVRSLLNFQCPLEVGLMVVRYLPRRILSQVSVLHALRSHASRPSEWMEIKGATGQGTICVRHVEYQGRLYINSIHSADGQQLRLQRDDLSALYSLLDPENVIIIGRDHLGIRTVLLGRPTLPDPSETQGLWWRFAPNKRAGSSVWWRSDGLKAREVHTQDTWKPTFWDSPRVEANQLRIVPVLEHHGECRMKYMQFQGCHAISYRWDRHIVAMGTHATKHDHSPYLDSVVPEDREVIDIYIPLEKNESICEVWRSRSKLTSITSLLLCTTAGRTILLGPRPTRLVTSNRKRHSYQLLSEACTGFHVDQRVSALAFGTPKPSRDSPRPRSGDLYPRTASPHPSAVLYEEYLYTSALLQGVCTVQPCRAIAGDRPVITGILFNHVDGRQSCVGQVRIDSLGAALEVGHQAPGMILRFAECPWGLPYVTSIELLPSSCGDKPARDPSVTELTVQWPGLLEWWVTRGQCRVHYGDKSSPPTKTRPWRASGTGPAWKALTNGS